MSGLTKRMLALYCPATPADTAGRNATTRPRNGARDVQPLGSLRLPAPPDRPRPRHRRRRGRRVGGRPRGLGRCPPAAGSTRTPSPPPVADRLADEFGAGRGALIAVYRGADGTDARSDAFQAAIAASLADLVKDPDVSGTIGYAETGDARFISNDGAVGLRGRRPQRHRRGVGPADRPVRVRDPRAHRRHRAAARRLRGADPRLDRPVRAGPAPRRDGLPPDRRLRPDPRVHLADLGRHPAPRRRPRDPDHARARVRRRPAGRDERLRLRTSRRCWGSRSRSTTRCSWSAGSARS